MTRPGRRVEVEVEIITDLVVLDSWYNHGIGYLTRVPQIEPPHDVGSRSG